ncbi:MAG: PQQ-binding-like beta-propeller repeat protein [Clostridium sp.]
MKKKTFLCLILTAAIFLSAFSTFRNEQGMDGANVVSSVTPEDTADCGAIWTNKFSTKGISYNSIPIIGTNGIYVVNSNILYELSYANGQVLRQTTLKEKMNSVCNMLLEEHFLYIPLANGTMECVDITSMTSLWQSKSFGGQSLSTTFYQDGYLYAGTTNVLSNGTTTGLFYCLNAKDGSTVWTYEDTDHPGGYYWSGAIVYEDALFFTGDNGILVSHSLTEPVVYDTAVLTTTANIRAGLTYHKETDALYTVAKDGTLFQIQCTEQKITKVSSGKIMNGAKFITCTSTPTIYNNRLYVGCMADQYGYVCVMDALTLKPIYQVKGFQNAEVKSSPLVSTRGSSTEEVTVYFSMNALPGGLYAFKDTEGKTSASLHTLYIPLAKQYCLSSITADDKGRLYYSNDSGTLFCVTLAKDIPATSTPTVTSIPAATSTPTVSNSPAPAAKKSVSKPKKPYSVKVKKSKKKYKVTWKKKSKKYQTIISYRYGKGKWKKKTIKKNTAATIKKGKKRLQIRLRCKIKKQSKWIYSSYTKTFSFRP